MNRSPQYDPAFDPRGCADCALPYPGEGGARCRRWGVPLPFKDNAPSACAEFEPREKHTSAPACFSCGRSGHRAAECPIYPPRAVIEYAIPQVRVGQKPLFGLAALASLQFQKRKGERK